MPAAETDNPFIMTYNALWALAEASSRLTDLVKLKNRIKFNFTGQSSPIKDEISNADVPELVLISSGSTGNLRNTSSSSMISRKYEWVLSTGDMSVVNKVLPVEWALFCAMTDYSRVLGALRWPADASDGFAKVTRLMDVDTGMTDADRNRGIQGWSSVWGIEVEMHFRTSDLIAVGTAGSGSG